jgi:hypothetical protein
VVQKGVYYDDVMSGKLSAGDKLRYKSDCVEITVEVTDTGTVILKKDAANVLDMVQAIKEGWVGMITLIAEKWSKQDTEFQDPHEIVKLALNKQRLFGKDQYVFEPLAPFQTN